MESTWLSIAALVVSVFVAWLNRRRTPSETRKVKVETDALEDANTREWVKLQLEHAASTIERLSARLAAVEAELSAEERQSAERERKIEQQSETLRTQELELAALRKKVHDQAGEIQRLREALTRAGFDPDTHPDDIGYTPS